MGSSTSQRFSRSPGNVKRRALRSRRLRVSTRRKETSPRWKEPGRPLRNSAPRRPPLDTARHTDDIRPRRPSSIEMETSDVTAQSARPAPPREKRRRPKFAPRQRHRHAQRLFAAGAERDGQGGREPPGRERRPDPERQGGSLTVDARPETASGRLRRKINLVIGPFASAYEALVEHPRLAELWPEYLIRQHQIIRATVPLTEAALARSKVLVGRDPLAEPLADYLAEHVDEELHHDETLLGDLELLGIDRESVVERMPSPEVAALVGSQYYWILHFHPVAFLGFVALMEGYPPTPELIETLVARTGFPQEAFTTYAEHAELDPGHRDRHDGRPLARGDRRAERLSGLATLRRRGRRTSQAAGSGPREPWLRGFAPLAQRRADSRRPVRAREGAPRVLRP